mmetsp:Transcript_36956/g.63818  ORF Transcript_36956/g.63818 Transcript_36956/m.63818 type:complete len:227 (-) Transcript_36956:664-1344(-)
MAIYSSQCSQLDAFKSDFTHNSRTHDTTGSKHHSTRFLALCILMRGSHQGQGGYRDAHCSCQHAQVLLTRDLFEHKHSIHRADETRSRRDDRKRDGKAQLAVGEKVRSLRNAPQDARERGGEKNLGFYVRCGFVVLAVHAIHHGVEPRRQNDAQIVREDIIQAVVITVILVVDHVLCGVEVGAKKPPRQEGNPDAHGTLGLFAPVVTKGHSLIGFLHGAGGNSVGL